MICDIPDTSGWNLLHEKIANLTERMERLETPMLQDIEPNPSPRRDSNRIAALETAIKTIQDQLNDASLLIHPISGDLTRRLDTHEKLLGQLSAQIVTYPPHPNPSPRRDSNQIAQLEQKVSNLRRDVNAIGENADSNTHNEWEQIIRQQQQHQITDLQKQVAAHLTRIADLENLTYPDTSSPPPAPDPTESEKWYVVNELWYGIRHQGDNSDAKAAIAKAIDLGLVSRKIDPEDQRQVEVVSSVLNEIGYGCYPHTDTSTRILTALAAELGEGK